MTGGGVISDSRPPPQGHVELKRIKKHDDSRLAKLLSTFSMSTLGWLGMRFVASLATRPLGPLNTLALKMADDAHSTEWQERTTPPLILFIFASSGT